MCYKLIENFSKIEQKKLPKPTSTEIGLMCFSICLCLFLAGMVLFYNMFLACKGELPMQQRCIHVAHQ